MGKYDESIKTFELAVKLRPTSHESYTSVGYCYECLKKYPEAVKFYNKALELRPNYSAALNNKKSLESYLKANRYGTRMEKNLLQRESICGKKNTCLLLFSKILNLSLRNHKVLKKIKVQKF
jgi:tetratricopeptide (TPR) repeat protein